MDFFDFLGLSAGEGSARMRWIAGITVGLIGALIGWYWGTTFGETELAPYSYGAIGAMIGGAVGAVFAFAFFFLLVIVLVVAAIVGFQIMTSGA